MVTKIVPDEIYKLIELEVSSFKRESVTSLLKEYRYGVSDMLVYFDGSTNLRILENRHLYDEKKIVNSRSQLLVSMLNMAMNKFADEVQGLELSVVMPTCFSDTSDDPIQKIPCLVFSKTAYSNNILIPSVNNLAFTQEIELTNYLDRPLHYKENKACFAGSLTGNTEDKIHENPRLVFASRYADNPLFSITLLRPPTVTEEDFADTMDRVYKAFPNLEGTDIIRNSEDKVSLEEQLKYKFQICIDGHTCAWARLPWQMNANCVPIKLRDPNNQWREWFYPLLDPSKHFLEVGLEEVGDTIQALIFNENLQRSINENGQEFISKYYSKDMALRVLLQTFILLNDKQENTVLRRELGLQQ